MKIKIYVNFHPSSEIGTLRVRGILWHHFILLNSITKYKTGLRSGGHSKYMFVLEGKGVSFRTKVIKGKGFIALCTFSVQKMSYCSKEFLESIFLNLVKVQKLDVTNKCYLAKKKVVLFNHIFYQVNCPMSVSSLANYRSPANHP